MGKKLTTVEFIFKAIKVHGDKYDYSKVEYINSKIKVCIICKKCGKEFWQTPNDHLGGHGCSKCGGSEALTTEIFNERCSFIHENKYDYSNVEYINSYTKVLIICPIHGEFWQTPMNHLHAKQGCPRCQMVGTNDFIIKSIKIHGDNYNYNKTNYKKCNKKVCIICNKCGREFWQTPSAHLQGEGCPICNKSTEIDTEEFIERSNKIHNDFFFYTKTIYVLSSLKVCITCPIHGDFWQKPNSHLQGKGCPKCNQSKLEKEVNNLLKEHNIIFEIQKTFDWLKSKKNMFLDFYLPEYNIAIECQGEQHFKQNIFFGGELAFEGIKKRDKLKYQLCKEHGIKVIYYNSQKDYENVLRNKNDLLSYINSNSN